MGRVAATPWTVSTPRRRSRHLRADYGAKWPKAVAKITDDLDVLLEFYAYPAED